jgi:CheY-like chemotaxis protein
MPIYVRDLQETDQLDQLLLKNKVVIMEDSETNIEIIINVLENELQYEVFVCDNQDEVIDIAKIQRPDLFILDNYIGNKLQEGFDALERIKNLDKAMFVAILTGFPTEDIQKQAKRLECDVFMEKTTDIKQNVMDIVDKMLEYRRKQIKDQLKPNNDFSEDKQAQNRKAYEECKLNPDWLEKHQGNYAAFVDGKFEFSCKDKDEFFDKLNNSDEYKEKQIFVAEVGKKEIIIEEPTSLWFELI